MRRVLFSSDTPSRLLVTLVMAVALCLALTGPAHAGGPYKYAIGQDMGRRLTVCAQSLGVRSSEGGQIFAYLHNPQTFDVKWVRYEFNNEWVYGFAYGHVNRHGWVQNGWFCF